MIEFSEADRAVVREASELLEEYARTVLAESAVDAIAEEASSKVERVMYLAGRLAGLSGRVGVEEETRAS